MPVLSQTGIAGQNEIQNYWLNSIIKPRELARVRNSVSVPYILNDNEITIIEGYLNGEYIKYSASLKRSSHPIAATLNWLANKDAVDHMINIKKPFIDIGSDLRIQEARHACVLVDGHRDASRYLNQATGLDSSLAQHIEENILRKVNISGRSCFNGAQRCNVQAEHAIAVNSLMDIDISNIPTIMYAHGIKILVAWLMLPLELMDLDLQQIRTGKFYNYKEEGKYSKFAFCSDMSFLYTHETDIWRKYLTTTLLQTPEFDVTIEIVRSMGPMRKLIFVRTPKYEKNMLTLSRNIPLSDYSSYVKIPNMRFVVASNFEVKYSDIPKLVVRRHIATNTYKFVCKGPDGAFSYERGATYLHGMTSRIVIGQVVVHEEADLDIIDYDDVLFSIIILAAMARLRRTKTFGKAMRNIDNNFEYQIKRHEFMDDLKRFKVEFGERLKNMFCGKKENFKFDFNLPNERDMMMYTFEFFKDIQVGISIDCKLSLGLEDNETKLNVHENRNRNPNKSIKNNKIAEMSNESSIISESENSSIGDAFDLISDDTSKNINLHSDSLNDNQTITTLQTPSENSNIDMNREEALSFFTKFSEEEFLAQKILVPKFEPSISRGVISRLVSEKTEIEIIDKIIEEIDIFDELLGENDEEFKRIRELETQTKFRSRAHAKIDEIMNKHFDTKKFDRIHEISIAPGNFSYTLCQYTKKLIGYHYTGHAALKMHERTTDNYHDIIEFQQLNDIKFERADLIVSDVGDEQHTNANLDVVRFQKFLNRGGSLIMKCWVHQIKEGLFKQLNFGSVMVTKPISSFSLNREVYLICKDYSSPNKYPNNWRQQLYVIVRRIKAMHQMYQENHMIDNFVEKSPKIEFTREVLLLNRWNSAKFISEFQEILEDDYQKLNEKIADKVKKMKHSTINVVINKHNAVFGSGKSDYIRKYAHKTKDLVVVPTKKLKVLYREMGYNAMTYYTAMISDKRYRNVFFDEVFMFPKSYFYYFAHFNKFENIYVFGDSKQIGVVDFKSVGYDDDDLINSGVYQNNVSKRVPQDVCNVMKRYDVDCKTTNPQKISIFTVDNIKEILDFFVDGVRIMTYRQAIKDIYTVANPKNDTHTIHERQGGNYDIVVWVLEEGDPILTRDEYVRVAFTRHTNALIIYGADNIKHTTMNLYNTNIEIIAERNIIPLFDENYYVIPETRLLKVHDQPFFEKRKISALDAMEVIGKIVDIYGSGANFDSIRTLNIPSMEQGRVKMSFDCFAKMDRNRTGKALLEYNTCRVYDSKDALASAQCLPGRYGIKTKLLNHINKEAGAKHLHNGLDKFLLHPRGSEKYEQHFMFDPIEINKHFKEYMESLNKKMLSAGELDAGFDEYLHTNGPLAIKYFMKKQTKFDSDQGWFEKAKFGQGVNAWSKLLNLVFAAYARFYSARLKNFLKPGVFYQNGAPDVAMGDESAYFLNQYMSSTGRVPEQVENDFSEYDASQNESTIQFDSDHIRDMGATEECVQLYREQRSEWVTVYPGFMVLIGKFKKQSGEPFTIDFNTTICMGAIGHMLDINNLVCAQFKGDDSWIAAESVNLTKEGRDFLTMMGMKAKLHKRDVSEFTGYIQTQYGPYRDTVRTVAKAFSKVFKDEKDFDEFKLAMHDYIVGINNRAQQIQGRASLAHYYNNLLIGRRDHDLSFTSEDMALLEDYMFNFKDIKYEELCEHKKDTITLGGVGGEKMCPYILV